MPTSHSSRGSITPLPHLVAERGTLQALVPEVHVPWVSSPSPVPLQTKSAQSPAISPLMENAPVSGSTVPAWEYGYEVEPTEQEPVTRSAVPVCTAVIL